MPFESTETQIVERDEKRKFTTIETFKRGKGHSKTSMELQMAGSRWTHAVVVAIGGNKVRRLVMLLLGS